MKRLILSFNVFRIVKSASLISELCESYDRLREMPSVVEFGYMIRKYIPIQRGSSTFTGVLYTIEIEMFRFEVLRDHKGRHYLMKIEGLDHAREVILNVYDRDTGYVVDDLKIFIIINRFMRDIKSLIHKCHLEKIRNEKIIKKESKLQNKKSDDVDNFKKMHNID